MKLYHFCKKSDALSIMAKGFNPPVQEGKLLEAKPWMAPQLLGQRGKDRVSLALGGRWAEPWKRMVSFSLTIHDESPPVCLEISVEDKKLASQAQAFPSEAQYHNLFLGDIKFGKTIEVTANREIVNDSPMRLVETLEPVGTKDLLLLAKMARNSEHWASIYRVDSEPLGQAMVQSLQQAVTQMEQGKVPAWAVKAQYVFGWGYYKTITKIWKLNPAQQAEIERLLEKFKT